MVCTALRLRLELNSILESPSFPDECPISNWPGTGVWFCVVWYGAPNSAWGIGHPSWTLSLRRTMDWVLEDSGSDAVCQWLEGSRTIWIYPGLSPKWRVCWPLQMFVETELAPNTNHKIKSISSWFFSLLIYNASTCIMYFSVFIPPPWLILPAYRCHMNTVCGLFQCHTGECVSMESVFLHW